MSGARRSSWVDSYWLYVVWGCKTEQPQLLTIQNPAKVLAGDVLEVKQVTRYVIGAAAIARCGVTARDVG